MASSYFKKCVGIYALQPKLYRDIRPIFPLGLSECLQVRLMDTIGSCGNRKVLRYQDARRLPPHSI